MANAAAEKPTVRGSHARPEFTATSYGLYATPPSWAAMFPRMKSSFALFCQAALVVIGIGVFAFLLWEPHVEGRNAHATVFQIYCQDPFLAYVYIGSTPFFVALYRAWRLFGHARQAGGFSLATLTALRARDRRLRGGRRGHYPPVRRPGRSAGGDFHELACRSPRVRRCLCEDAVRAAAAKCLAARRGLSPQKNGAISRAGSRAPRVVGPVARKAVPLRPRPCSRRPRCDRCRPVRRR